MNNMTQPFIEKSISDVFLKTLNQRVQTLLIQQGHSRFGNTRMFLKIGIYFTTTICLYTLMLMSETVIEFYVFYILMALSSMLTAMNVGHDAAHRAIFKQKTWNDTLFWLSFQLMGSSSYLWKRNHVTLHHHAPNVELNDPDIPQTPLVRFIYWQKWRWFHQYQHIYIVVLYAIYTMVYFFISEQILLLGFDKSQPSVPKNEVFKAFLSKILFIVLFWGVPFYLKTADWEHLTYAFLSMQILFSLILTLFLGVSHLSDKIEYFSKNNKENISWVALQLRTAADYDVEKRWAYWFLGGFNAHALHHLLPSVCHIHYRQIVPIFRKTVAEFGFHYVEVSYFDLLKSHFRYLKKMGQKDGHN